MARRVIPAVARERLAAFAAEAIFDGRRPRPGGPAGSGRWVERYVWRGVSGTLAEWARRLDVSRSWLWHARRAAGTVAPSNLAAGIARDGAGRRTAGTCVACLDGPRRIYGADRCHRCYGEHLARQRRRASATPHATPLERTGT
jgi:hypothetical protein